MKSLINIIILVLLFSCSNKKSNNANATNNLQHKELHNVSKDTLPKNINTATSPQIKTEYNSEEYKKHADSIIKNVHEVSAKKHKEIPPDGTYIYGIAYAEWQGRSLGEKVKVVIKGNAIKIIAIGRSSVGVNDGEIIDEGTLIKHNVTGDWLITGNPSDADLEVYGGCVGAPMVIDFVNKKYWTC